MVYSVIFTVLSFLILFPSSGNANLSWNSAVTVYSSDGELAINPSLTVTPSGEVYAIWSTEIGADSFAVQAAYASNASWSSPLTIATMENSPLCRVQSPSIGSAIAVWDQFDGAAYDLMGALFDGANWSSPTQIASLGDSIYSSNLTLSTNFIGKAVVSWKDTNNRIQAATYAGSWSSPYYLSQLDLPLVSGISFPTSICSNGLLASILYTNSGSYQYEASLSSPPAEPTNPLVVPYGASSLANPVLSGIPNQAKNAFLYVDESKFYILAGVNYKGTGNDEVVGNWYTTVVSQAGTASDPPLFLAADINPNNSRVAAAWQLQSNLVQVSLFNKLQWSFPFTLSSAGSNPAVAFNPVNSHLIAVWVEDRVLCREWDGNAWSDLTALSSLSDEIGPPAIRISPQGDAVAIWHRRVGNDIIIESSFAN